jgi:hypothetical protein
MRGETDARPTRHAGHRISQRVRQRIEEGFGWGMDGRPRRKMTLTGKAQFPFMATCLSNPVNQTLGPHVYKFGPDLANIVRELRDCNVRS